MLGTNCVDNGPRQGLEKFLNAASESPSTVLHYEFVQDYRGGCKACCRRDHGVGFMATWSRIHCLRVFCGTRNNACSDHRCRHSLMVPFTPATRLACRRSTSDPAISCAVHIKHTDGHFEYIPYFSLPANDLTDVIAPSCYSCFDYPNALAVRADNHHVMPRRKAMQPVCCSMCSPHCVLYRVERYLDVCSVRPRTSWLATWVCRTRAASFHPTPRCFQQVPLLDPEQALVS